MNEMLMSGKDITPCGIQRQDVRVPSKEVLRSSGQVQSLSRALKLLNALSYHPQGLSLSELAREVGLPNSTAHRLLTTLQNERYVRFDNERSVWMIGVQAFQVGSAFIRSRDLVQIARPVMRRLMMAAGETVNLGIIDRCEVIYLAQVETKKMMRTITGPGGRAYVHASGIGKALLAFAPEHVREQIFQCWDARQLTMRTITSEPVLREELEKIRRQGYAVDDEETAVGLRCVASVIFDENAEAIAGISVSGPTARITDARLKQLGALVMEAAFDITQDIGGRWQISQNPAEMLQQAGAAGE